MKQAQNARKQRGRSPSRKGGGKSGGPGNMRNEPKVRGNPKQLLEKYKNQAREAKQAGDRVMAEYYYQFADHYQRVLNEVRGPNPQVEDDDDALDVDGNREGGQDNRRSEQRNGDGQQRRGRGRSGGRDNRDMRDGEDAAENSESNSGDDGDDRRSRPRRGRQPRRAPATADPAKSEQPVEVHPELDLNGTVAQPNGGEEAEEKPKRRRASANTTPRKRTPRAKKVEDGAEASQEDNSPEDNAAA